MADRVYVSLNVLAHSFHHIADAINAWGDVDGAVFNYQHGDLVIDHRQADLFVMSSAERAAPHVAFHVFDLRNPSDFIAIFGGDDW